MSRRLLGVLLGGLLLAGGCGSNQLVVTSELGAPLDLWCGDARFALARGQALTVHEGSWSAGTRLVARVQGQVVEELALSAEQAGVNLVWNVKGSSPVHAVDYTGCYGADGKAAPGGTFRVLASLEGRSLWVVPPCQLVNYTQPFPHTRIGIVPVVRLERVSREAVTTTLEDLLRKQLATELDVRGRMEFPR